MLAKEESALFLLESTEPFPVDLDDAIAWWDCRTKEGKPMRRDNIVTGLKADFIKDIDYREVDSTRDTGSRPFAPEISGAKGLEGKGGYNKKKISLSIDCFKQFGMMSSGDRYLLVPLFHPWQP